MVIQYAFLAVRHPYKPGKWLGQFTGESLGARWVKDQTGAQIVFDTEAGATAAANRALIRALNEPAGPIAGKAFSVRGQATGRRQARLEAESLFPEAGKIRRYAPVS